MGTNRNQEQWNQIMEYYRDGYTKAQIGRMLGLTRQRVGIIIQSYEKDKQKIMNNSIKLSDFQLRKLDTIVYDKIKMFLLKSNITLNDFCKMIDKETKTNYRAISFLTGKSNVITPEMISEIVSITGCPIEEILDIKCATVEAESEVSKCC